MKIFYAIFSLVVMAVSSMALLFGNNVECDFKNVILYYLLVISCWVFGIIIGIMGLEIK